MSTDGTENMNNIDLLSLLANKLNENICCNADSATQMTFENVRDNLLKMLSQGILISTIDYCYYSSCDGSHQLPAL